MSPTPMLVLLPLGAPLRTAGGASRAARSLLLETFPHGGQHTARRNAWAAMSADAARARGRRDSVAAVAAAVARADSPTRAGRDPGRTTRAR